MHIANLLFLPFYLFPFFLSRYHSVTLIHNILYRSFFISEREGCLLPLKADTNQVHSPIGLPFIGIGNGPYRLTDGSIIVGQRLLAGVLIHSHDIFGKLIDRLDKERYRSRPILLTILPPEP